MRRTSPDGTKQPVKPLGAYLIESGLLSADQVHVILLDQAVTGLRFGEIAALRGWVKQETIDYLMSKVVQPERSGAKLTGSRQSQIASHYKQTLIQDL